MTLTLLWKGSPMLLTAMLLLLLLTALAPYLTRPQMILQQQLVPTATHAPRRWPLGEESA